MEGFSGKTKTRECAELASFVSFVSSVMVGGRALVAATRHKGTRGTSATI